MDHGAWEGYSPDVGRLEAEVKVLQAKVKQLEETLAAMQKALRNVDFSSLIRYGKF